MGLTDDVPPPAPLPPPPAAPTWTGDWEALAARLRRLARRTTTDEGGRRRAAVLVPLFEREGDLHVILTRRQGSLRAHPGQVAFPGGTIGEGEAPLTAALREAEEELALPRALVTPLGALHDVDTTTGFVLTPFVARVPADVVLVGNPAEVARVFTTPLRILADPARRETHEVEHRGLRLRVPAWRWDGETIWGATGRVLADLVLVLA